MGDHFKGCQWNNLAKALATVPMSILSIFWPLSKGHLSTEGNFTGALFGPMCAPIAVCDSVASGVTTSVIWSALSRYARGETLHQCQNTALRSNCFGTPGLNPWPLLCMTLCSGFDLSPLFYVFWTWPLTLTYMCFGHVLALTLIIEHVFRCHSIPWGPH